MARPFVSFLALGCGLAGLAGCAATPSAVTTSAPASSLGAQALLGSTQQVLNADFGPPVLRRVDGQAQVWVYQSASCGLQFFLYPDAAGTPRVAAALPQSDNPQSCMQSFAHGVTAAALESRASS
ncbi:hypothetical protein [Acidocella sp.]|uniref:hypothetical protein n=1 Tax=Acidocella sp. TaxID=50710 RepID=UPI0026291CAC|nr:hypothetical protein [Acidocella sp.]